MAYCAKRDGFSIVEVVVTASIIVVLATLIIIQIRNLSPKQALDTAQDDARSLFVLARTYALNGQLCCGAQSPAGYGLVTTIDGHPDNTVNMYADLDGDQQYSTGDTILQTITLTTNIDLTQCADATVTVTSGTCDILFSTAGDNKWYFNGLIPNGTWQLTLQYYGKTETTPLLVYGFGIIE